MAVPPPAWMLEIAFCAPVRSKLGALRALAVSENETTPTRKPSGRFLTKRPAASREAVMRSGGTSWASIEPERSSASTIVPCLRSAETDTLGRASPTASAASAASSRTGGTNRQGERVACVTSASTPTLLKRIA